MAFDIDETLSQEEQERIFREMVENARKHVFRIIYDKAVEMGASAEEAAKEATEHQDNFAL